MGRQKKLLKVIDDAVKAVSELVDHPNPHLREFLRRHITVKENGCWEWKGDQIRPAPVVYVGYYTDERTGGVKSKLISVRKLMMMGKEGRPIYDDAKHRAKCGLASCVNPYHQSRSGVSFSGLDGKAVRELKKAAELRRKVRQLTDEMRRKGLTTEELANRFGVSKPTMRSWLSWLERNTA